MYITSDELCPQLFLVCPVFIAQVLCTHMSHSVQEIQSMTSAASIVLYWSSALKQIPHISVSVSCNSVCVCCVSLSDGLPILSVIVFRLTHKLSIYLSCTCVQDACVCRQWCLCMQLNKYKSTYVHTVRTWFHMW